MATLTYGLVSPFLLEERLKHNKRIKELERELERLRAEEAKEDPTTRVCSLCGEAKPLEDFTRNRAKPGGRAYRCKECHAEVQRDYAKRKLKDRKAWKHATYTVSDTRPQPMMTEEAFRKYYDSAELRTFIITYSVRHAKQRPELQKDLRQIAWAMISQCEGGMTLDYYIKVAKNAMYNEYRREYYRRKYELSYEESMSKEERRLWSTGVYIDDRPE